MQTTASIKLGHVLLMEEANPLRAYLVVGALEDAGIPCVVEDDNLADEFSMIRKLSNMQGSRIWVPTDRFDEARVVFLGMTQPIPIIAEDDPELEAYDRDYIARQGRANLWMIMPGLILLATALLILALSR